MHNVIAYALGRKGLPAESLGHFVEISSAVLLYLHLIHARFLLFRRISSYLCVCDTRVLCADAVIGRVRSRHVEGKLQWFFIVQKPYYAKTFLYAFLFIFERFNSALEGFKFRHFKSLFKLLVHFDGVRIC